MCKLCIRKKLYCPPAQSWNWLLEGPPSPLPCTFIHMFILPSWSDFIKQLHTHAGQMPGREGDQQCKALIKGRYANQLGNEIIFLVACLCILVRFHKCMCVTRLPARWIAGWPGASVSHSHPPHTAIGVGITLFSINGGTRCVCSRGKLFRPNSGCFKLCDQLLRGCLSSRSYCPATYIWITFMKVICIIYATCIYVICILCLDTVDILSV